MTRLRKVIYNKNQANRIYLNQETSVNELVYNELRAYGGCLGTERR